MSETLIRSLIESVTLLRAEHDILSEEVRRKGLHDGEIRSLLERHDEKLVQLERWKELLEYRESHPKSNLIIQLLETLLAAKSIWYIFAAGLMLILIYWAVVQDGLSKLLHP